MSSSQNQAYFFFGNLEIDFKIAWKYKRSGVVKMVGGVA
jgi:hypothetical protein